PEGDRHTHTREFLEAQIAILMGGRIAEELFLRQMTSGAGNDIERATEIARRMVCEFGMSAALGPLAYRTPGNPWETDKGAGISESMAQQVDQEIKDLVMRGYETARQIIAKNRGAVRAMAEELLVVEALDFDGIKAVVAPGYSDTAVYNSYGLVIGTDGALYFCDLDNQRIRRFDPATRRMTTIAGSGERGYKGDGGPAVSASLNMPHEIRFDAAGNLFIAERDNHVVRRVDRAAGVITTVAGTGAAGFSGDGGPGAKAQLRQPHSIVFDRDGTLLICDIGNHRIRRLHLDTGTIETYAGAGTAAAAPDGAPLRGAPLNGPRTLALAANGDLYVALREGNAIYRIDAGSQTLRRIAGTGESGYTGDGGPALDAKL